MFPIFVQIAVEFMELDEFNRKFSFVNYVQYLKHIEANHHMKTYIIQLNRIIYVCGKFL